MFLVFQIKYLGFETGYLGGCIFLFQLLGVGLPGVVGASDQCSSSRPLLLALAAAAAAAAAAGLQIPASQSVHSCWTGAHIINIQK